MFNLKIVSSDIFLDMSGSARELYFHLGMYADDDGFVNPKKVMRMIGASEDDLKILIAKRFLLIFESGVVVIKHWLIHNLLRGDRYSETDYKLEKSTMRLNEWGAYTEKNGNSQIKEIKKIDKPEWQKNRQQAKKDSDLPDSFDYKIRRAFIGKNCPICKNIMQKFATGKIEYGMKSNPLPSIQHNIPISQGGKHELENISVICHSCNVSLRDKETDALNNKEVIEAWNTIGNQSATQVRLGKERLGKVSKENTAETAGMKDEVNLIFEPFYKTINPQINFSRKDSRDAAIWLINKYGFPVTLRACEYACKIFSEEYAPSIKTPAELKNKWANLVKYKITKEGVASKGHLVL